MIAEVFVDNTVAIYAAAGRRVEPAKPARAREIIRDGRYGRSAQVLAEFYVNVRKEPRTPLSSGAAAAWVADLQSVPVAPVDAELVTAAIACSQRDQISHCDGSIIAAAERPGATALYTEDLNDGQTFGPVTAINPFNER